MTRILLYLCLVGSLHTLAQKPDQHDYTRAISFLWENLNNKKAFNLHTVPNWFTDSTGFWYVHFVDGSRVYNKITFKPIRKEPLFDHEQLAEKLNA